MAVYAGLSALMLAGVACLCGPLSSIPGLPGGAGGAATPTLMSLDGGSSSGGSTTGGNSASNGTFSFLDPDKAALKSYHSKFTMTYSGTKEDGTAASGSFSMEQLHTTDPLATSMDWSGTGDAIAADKAGGFQMTQIGDTSYIITPDKDGKNQCVAMTSAGTGANSTPPYGPDMFMAGDMSKARRILPDEVVNNILSEHWQFTNTDLALMGGNWTNYTVDAWTAVDGGYATKSTFVGDGTGISGVGGQGHIEWEFDLLEANTAITIDPPQGCEAPAGSDLPKMPDAADAISMAGFNSYTTASSVADVVAFYQAQMPAAGWTAGEASTSDQTSSLKFTKDGKTASITITSDGTKTTVLMQVQ